MERGLFWASEYGRNDVVEFLLQKGVSLDARSPDGQTPLHWAVGGGQLETIKPLLARGANLEAGIPTAAPSWAKPWVRGAR